MQFVWRNCQVDFLSFLCDPFKKSFVGFFPGMDALIHTAQQKLEVVDAGFPQECTGGFCGLCPYAQPVQCAIYVYVQSDGIGLGIVKAQFLYEFAITGCPTVCHDNPEEGSVAPTMSCQSDANSHESNDLFFFWLDWLCPMNGMH